MSSAQQKTVKINGSKATASKGLAKVVRSILTSIEGVKSVAFGPPEFYRGKSKVKLYPISPNASFVFRVCDHDHGQCQITVQKPPNGMVATLRKGLEQRGVTVCW